MEDLKPVAAKNLIELRRSMNWTQAELAKKLNYSDKAVSKWERAESIPDVAVLKAIADLFGVTVDYLLEAEHQKKGAKNIARQRRRFRLTVALVSASLVFLVATIVYVFLELIPNPAAHYAWKAYIYAVPGSCIVLLVFNSLWGRHWVNLLIISALMWSVMLSLYLSFPFRNFWLIFIIGIPGQVIILLWTNFMQRRR